MTHSPLKNGTVLIRTSYYKTLALWERGRRMKVTGKQHLIWILALTIYPIFSYSATLIVNNGTLMGATGVTVNGSLYDVSFQDGTCIELYNGCNDNTNFLFTNPNDLNDDDLLYTAMNALLDQVFIDSSLGLFDQQPNLMNGCNVPGGCNITTPLWVSEAGGLGVIVTHNWAQEHQDVVSIGGGPYNTIDFSPQPGVDFDINVYAVWSVSPIPEPSTYILILIGLGIIGAMSYNQLKTIIKSTS